MQGTNYIAMDRQYIHDNHIIERYLQNKLSEEEAAEFEEHYLSDATTLEELELAESLQHNMKELEQAGDLKWMWARRLFLSPQYATAATVLAMISMLFSGLLYQRVDTVDVTSVSTRIVPIFATRGTSANVIAHPAGDEQIVLLVDPGILDYASYRATVDNSNAGGGLVWQKDGLTLGYEEMLALALPGKLLSPSAYQITIEGLGVQGYERLTQLDFAILANSQADEEVR